MSQTIVRNDMREGVPGQIYDSAFTDVISKSAEGTIQFGHGVIPGTDPETQCQDPIAATPIVDFLGVAARDNKEQQFVPNLGVNEYDDEDTVGILQSGRIWAAIGETVDIADTIWLMYDDGTTVATALRGEFVQQTDAGNNTQISAGARWFKGGVFAATGDIAVLQVGPWPVMAP